MLGSWTERLVSAAQRCSDRHARGRARDVERLGRLVADVDETFCGEVAERFDRLPRMGYDVALARRYRQLKRETRLQYEAIVDAGIRVEPWLGLGQPYHDSGELVRGVRETGTIQLFLTRSGHGPYGGAGFHPMRESTGISVKGVELTHNDLFRVVHDVFGHVMFGHSFGPDGELQAAYCQMALLPEVAQPVVFTEQVAQTCWFFFGPHLRDEAGRVPRRGERGYVAPHRRPYPEQKVFAPEPRQLEAFGRMFRLRALR